MTDGDTQDPPTLNEATERAYRARREALHAAVSDLDQRLNELEARADPPADELEAALEQLLGTLERHIAESEDRDGLLAQVVDEAPWFGPRAERLRAEHADLLEATNELLGRAGDARDVPALIEETRRLGARVDAHRHAGTTLLLDAYSLDVSAGD